MDALLEELVEFLRIPSVSTGGGDPAALRRAAEWVCERVRSAGGEAWLEESEGNPLARGELRASAGGRAPTVLVYGHYDVQGPGPAQAWASPPFEPDIRDGRIYARGACDDKGNFLPTLHVACRLARAGRLPVNVRVVVEGEEETGSDRVCRWVAGDPQGADCAVVFDSTMVDERTPALTVGTRGIVSAAVEVRTAARDVHSGLYGGPALNAAHVLHRMLHAVMPDADGVAVPELREGVEPPGAAERAAWAALPAGAAILGEMGSRAVSEAAARDFHRRTGADASLDVNGLAAGDAAERRTIVPAVARANLSLRVAPGQSGARLAATLERLLRDGAHPAADVAIDLAVAEPSRFDPESPPLKAARRALERACGVAPALVRLGGTLPILAALSARGIPAIVSGFAVAEDALHAPNESFRLAGLRDGARAAHALYEELGRLPAPA